MVMEGGYLKENVVNEKEQRGLGEEQRRLQEEQELFLTEKRAQPQPQQQRQQQRLTAPLPPLPWPTPLSHQQDDLQDVNGEGYWKFDAEMTEGVGALIVTSDSSGAWWFGVGEAGGGEGMHDKEDMWKRAGIGTG